jgi:hypothetical protein
MTFPRIPESASTSADLLGEALDDTLPPGESLTEAEVKAILLFLRRGPYPYGGQHRILVLGSHDPPFVYRLYDVLDRLNREPQTHAYLQITQPDIGLPDRLPETAIKFHLLAGVADEIGLVLEHNEGGALPEADRLARTRLLDKSHIFLRNHDDHGLPSEPADDCEELARLALSAAYDCGSEGDLRARVRHLVDQAAVSGVTTGEVMDWLAEELGGKEPASISGVITDHFGLLAHRQRLHHWWVAEDLYAQAQAELLS